MRASRAALVLVVLFAGAACNGSAAQRRALDVKFGSGSAAVPVAGGTEEPTGSAADQAANAPAAGEAPSAGSPVGGGASSAAPSAGVRNASPKSGSPTAAASPGSVAGLPSSAAGARSPAGQPATSGPSAATPAAPAAAEQASASDVGVTGTSIKIGHIGIYSGPVGAFGQSLSWAGRATLQSINDSGGVNGRKLDVLVRDDGWDGTKGMNAARDLVERQKVFALCCIESVSTSDPVTPYADQMKVPHVGGDGWGDIQYKGAWSFPLGVPSASEARVLAKYQVQKLGVKTAAVMYLNNSTGQSFRDAYRKTLEDLGARVVVDQPATFDDPGTTTLIARARTANVDTIAVYADPGIFARMIREAAGQSYRPPKGFSGSTMFYFNVTPSLAGPWAEGAISMNHWTPHDQDTPGLRRYREIVTRYYPNIDHTAWTQTGYSGASLLGDTLKRLGLNVTRQRLKDTLDQTTDYDLGLGSRISFRPGQHHANSTLHVVQLQREGDDMKWKTVGYDERDATYDSQR
ncbi:MAG: branched-chain amino acid transport system substrate-binding protein [Actinomycetota bacterium]|nr:branched-chain amino acid transport system substrate-binding protein [Actinomycetota bacterium]MDQ1504604.1 branched-chain amino acid transport system substrate-binding protein [Actinomycetota bacterium]